MFVLLIIGEIFSVKSQTKEYKLAKRVVDSMDEEGWYDLAVDYLFEQFNDDHVLYVEKLEELDITEDDL